MRYLTPELERITSEEPNKMLLIAGPRQAGKTTLMKTFLANHKADHSYFNWDIDPHRKAILKGPIDFWRPKAGPVKTGLHQLVGLDEIHKYPRWKRFLKGLYDACCDQLTILVTGSGRLDVYQRGGDSLLGRYYLYRLHPLSVGELIRNNRISVCPPQEALGHIFDAEVPKAAADALTNIDLFTGFPEPLFKGDQRSFRQWQRIYHKVVLREDVRDLTRVREIGLVEAMVDMLPHRLRSPVSVNALREDLGVAYGTVAQWLAVLSRLYYLFELRPYVGKMSRTLRRESKFYLFNPGAVQDPGARFENLLALHMRKLVDAWNDWGFGDFGLFYVRDKEHREVDFLITSDGKPYWLVEAKLGEDKPEPALVYFHQRLLPKISIQIVKNVPVDFLRQSSKGVWLCSAARFLAQTP